MGEKKQFLIEALPEPAIEIITEYDPAIQKIPNSIGIVESVLGHTEKVNKNLRLYSKEQFWIPLITKNERFKFDLENKRLFGETDHPEQAVGSATRISHITTSVWLDDDGYVRGRHELLPTPAGKLMAILMEAGVKYGVSSRALIESEFDANNIEIVDGATAEIFGWDFVIDPSTVNGFVTSYTPLQAKGVEEALAPLSESYKRDQVFGLMAPVVEKYRREKGLAQERLVKGLARKAMQTTDTRRVKKVVARGVESFSRPSLVAYERLRGERDTVKKALREKLSVNSGKTSVAYEDQNVFDRIDALKRKLDDAQGQRDTLQENYANDLTSFQETTESLAAAKEALLELRKYALKLDGENTELRARIRKENAIESLTKKIESVQHLPGVVHEAAVEKRVAVESDGVATTGGRISKSMIAKAIR